MRIEIDDNSAALTPFGSLVSAKVRSKNAGKPWTIAFQADRSHRESSPNALPAALLTTAMIAIILIGAAKSSLGTSTLGQSNATSSYVMFNALPLTLSDHW
jgi:hypothetical protein